MKLPALKMDIWVLCCLVGFTFCPVNFGHAELTISEGPPGIQQPALLSPPPLSPPPLSIEQTISNHLERSRALEIQGDYSSALAEALAAQKLSHALQDDRTKAEAAFQVGYINWRMANYAEALGEANQAFILQQPQGESEALIKTLSLLGAIRQSMGDYSTALEMDLRALSMGESLGDEIAVARVRNNIGLIYWDLGRFDDAYHSLQLALEIHERLGPRDKLANTLNNIGLVLIELNQPQNALPFLYRTLNYAMEDGDPYAQAKSFSNLGSAYALLGDTARAFDYYEQALTLRQSIGDRDGEARTLSVLADLYLRKSETSTAVELLQKALSIAIEIGERRSEAEVLHSLSLAFEKLGNADAALSTFHRYHDLAEELTGSETTRRIGTLEADYAAKELKQEIETTRTLAEARQEKVHWLIISSTILVISLFLLGTLYYMRLRVQRALAESEKRYRSVFQNSMVPTFLVELESGNIIDLNEPARKLFIGLSNDTQSNISNLEPQWVRAPIEQIIHEGSGDHISSDCWTDEAGKDYWSEVRSTTVSLDGKPCQLVSFQDTTQSRLAELARQREDKMSSLGTLAGGIAHGFNNALTAIVGHISLARTTHGVELDRNLEFAEEAAMGARDLSDQLLAFSRGGKPVKQVTNVGRLLREAVDLANSRSSMKINLDIADDLMCADLDSSQFSQLVNSLVVNAREATESNGRLTIHASNFPGPLDNQHVEGDSIFIRIDFEDNGPGIPVDIRQKIFDPYFTTRSDRNGLGLASAYTICVNHGGTLLLDSSEGIGSRFSAFFPATTAQEAERPMAPVTATKGEGKGRILVLEDEPLVQDVLCQMLRHSGYEVDAADEGQAAVHQYLKMQQAGRPYDLLIMDLTIPGGMGGRQALAEIHSFDKSARAIVVSGYSDDPTMSYFEEAGFVAALAKPFHHAALIATVKEALNDP